MSVFEASRYVARIELIDLEELWQEGVRFLLVDRDNTCMARSTMRVEPPVAAWFGKAHNLGFATCLVSNNFHGTDVEATARSLGSTVVHHAMKPAPFALTHALAREGFSASESVLIGDQIFTDVVAGHLAHIPTILVHPLSRTDLWYTQIFRLVEHPLLKGHTFEGDR
ncbi:MAG: YqeG family HAD IIIA-type phosphatase [Atopobiaceae bacterium]